MSPFADRQKQVASWLAAGKIIYVDNEFALTPKFVIVASLQPDFLCFSINSEIHDFIKRRPHLMKCQVSIHQSDHRQFLTRNSHANCSKVISDLTLTRVHTQLRADLSRMKGQVTDRERQQIIAAIKFSTQISEVIRKRLLTDWEPLTDEA